MCFKYVVVNSQITLTVRKVMNNRSSGHEKFEEKEAKMETTIEIEDLNLFSVHCLALSFPIKVNPLIEFSSQG